MITDINGEDRLVQQTFAQYLHDRLGWDSVYAWQRETFGPSGTLGRSSERDVVLVRDLREALLRLNPRLPEQVREQAIERLARVDVSRSLVQHNREFYDYIRDGVPVEWRDESGEARRERAGPGSSRAPLQSPRRHHLLRQRPSACLHRAEGGLQEHTRWVLAGDHRRLQPREGPRHGGGDVRQTDRSRAQPERKPERRAKAGRRGGAQRRRTGRRTRRLKQR